jgi:hypothetical protein
VTDLVRHGIQAFVDGLASLVDLCDSLRTRRRPGTAEDDARALRKDWDAVLDDLSVAWGQVRREVDD